MINFVTDEWPETLSNFNEQLTLRDLCLRDDSMRFHEKDRYNRPVRSAVLNLFSCFTPFWKFIT